MSEKKALKPEKTVKKSSFFREVMAEVGIITWPSKNETKKALIAVLIFTIIYIILVGGLDFTFKNLFAMMLKLK